MSETKDSPGLPSWSEPHKKIPGNIHQDSQGAGSAPIRNGLPEDWNGKSPLRDTQDKMLGDKAADTPGGCPDQF